MREEGATVELFFTRKLEIKPCSGEFNCWFKTPGRCFQKDDMEMLLPKIDGADIIVFATPLYADGVSGPMKNLMDRQLPRGIPYLEFRDGRCRHPMGENHRPGKIVLVSSCGLWEMENFDPILAHMKAYSQNMLKEFAGALLRPHSPALSIMAQDDGALKEIVQAAKQAGRQLVSEGKMSVDVLKTVSRELIPAEEFVTRLNQLIELGLEAAKQGQQEEKSA
jgi:multimeric flavodoxin WrbA